MITESNFVKYPATFSNAAKSPTPVPMVSCSLELLHGGLIELAERLRGMEDSLRPVLVSASPVPQSGQSTPESERSPLDQQICNAIHQIVTMNDHLRDICNRLTV